MRYIIFALYWYNAGLVMWHLVYKSEGFWHCIESMLFGGMILPAGIVVRFLQ